jgi:excisionase family DNA binding protein
MSESLFLTTREVAKLLKVSDATVKRWAESEQLRSERTSGGHRRFRADEVARFQREAQLGLKQSHGDVSVTRLKKRRLEAIGRKGSPLFNSLIAGSEEEAAEQLIGYQLKGTPLPEIFDELISSAMLEVGDMWSRGEISVTQEHLATRAAIAAVHKLRSLLPVPRMTGLMAMCCTIEGDLHDLPIYLAQLVMEDRGWEVINFGANTPLYALNEEITMHPPNLLCISATIISDPERLVRDYRLLKEKAAKLRIPVVLGGKAFAEERIRERFPADLYASSYAQIDEFVTSRFAGAGE